MTPKQEKILDRANDLILTADSRKRAEMLRYFVATMPWSRLQMFIKEFDNYPYGKIVK